MSEDLLPAEFIAAVAAKAAPNSSVADFVAQQTCARPDGLDRDRLLASLLTTAFRDSAPPPLLKAAVDRGLTSEQDYWTGSRIDLAALALAHSDCDNSLRESALQQCTDSQLGNLGTTDRPTVLTAAVAAELRRRSAGPVPMTRQLLEQPTPAQVVLATSPLADSVFEAALELLPTEPRFALDPDDTDFEGWYAAFRDCMAAWKQMWRSVVQHHADRHLKLVQRTEGTSANGQIRDLLLSEMPWTVEPSLLKDLALADLAGFHAAVLATRLCRERRDGATIPSIRERFADQIDKLDEGGRRRVEMYLDEEGLDPTQFCNQATDWAARAAGGNWRLLLNPTEATHYGDPRPWQASPDDLKTLGRTFAQTTVSALAMWEPDPDRPVPALALLPWTVEVLTHLPIITEEVKAAVGPIIDTARQGLRSGPYRSLYNPDHRDVAELVATIEKIVAEPAPDVAARRSALGDPATVTVRDLARVEPDLLVSYLDRHPGDDALVDKALLALASVSRHSESVRIFVGETVKSLASLRLSAHRRTARAC
ncbi:hypothetical protein IU510_30680 [Nocardia cyriacigeorgica]|uniref:hypothetical protein n=1 Tax=Nocardia cyriacigeorgica TaxID=135487 RepID=UPI0018933CF1|nr:hypothetical protein [Nocardia cyriacigeorgica]MBF6102384.1 hypothetical protein [Nocardia cyriacigeorgica]